MICADGKVEIRVGDCRDLLRAMPDQSVDAIVTDPPYGQTSLQWDCRVGGWAGEARRVLKKTGSMWVFGSLRSFMATKQEFTGWRFAEDIVWEKHNGSSFHSDRFRRVHEQAAHWYRDDAKWSEVFKHVPTTQDATARVVRRKKRPTHMGAIESSHYTSEDGGPRLVRSVICVRSCHGYAVHPTQKPEGIIEPLILNSCPIGGTVLDPFGGSGTTGLVAARHRRNAILLEQSLEYAEMAHKRISREWREPFEDDEGPIGGLFAGI